MLICKALAVGAARTTLTLTMAADDHKPATGKTEQAKTTLLIMRMKVHGEKSAPELKTNPNQGREAGLKRIAEILSGRTIRPATKTGNAHTFS
ncbi:hypothetical protein [Brucella sp. NBRC 12953]|uniref:hypothetical protein n=1 Tax=Brucella sp. NBRC 12953 TaxID=3075481 RepID=UPI00333FAE3A